MVAMLVPFMAMSPRRLMVSSDLVKFIRNQSVKLFVAHV